MEMKKIILQLVIGIASVALFTGCSRDIIEHQFHVDSETNTEYVTETVNAQELMQRFEDYLKQHGFDTKLVLGTNSPDKLTTTSGKPAENPLDDVSIHDVSPEKLNQWLTDPDSRLCIYTECERDGGLYEQLPIIMNHMNKFYVALQSLGDDWEEGEGFQGKRTMHVLSSMVEQDGAYYIESVLTTKYLYKRN